MIQLFDTGRVGMPTANRRCNAGDKPWLGLMGGGAKLPLRALPLCNATSVSA